MKNKNQTKLKDQIDYIYITLKELLKILRSKINNKV